MGNGLNYTQTNKLRHGFTLVELLVVISIIALLMSILMPSLSKAREQAKKIQCGAHLKSMGLAMYMYSVDYNDYFPAMLMSGHMSTTNPGWSHWWQLAMSYASNSEKLLQCPSLKHRTFVNVNWDSETFLTGFGLNYCGWTWKSSWVLDDPEAGLGYLVHEDSRFSQPRGGCVKATNVRKPSSFIMIGDANRNINDSPERIKSIFTYGILGPPRVHGNRYDSEDMPSVHNNGANIVFADGHLNWLKTDDLLADENMYMWKRGGK